jgi:hypothetical protein
LSSSSAKGFLHHIEKEMANEIKVKVIVDMEGELVVYGINFDSRALLSCLIKALWLTHEAKLRNVQISITVDGAKLYSNIHHLAIGFTNCDKMARDPVSGFFGFSMRQD